MCSEEIIISRKYDMLDYNSADFIDKSEVKTQYYLKLILT